MACQIADAALEAATEASDRWATAWALGILAIVNVMQGENTRALPLFRRALAASEGDPTLADLQLVLQVNHAAALGDLDRYDEAIRVARQVLQSASSAGNLVRLAQAQSVMAELLFDTGRWDEALAPADRVPGESSDPAVDCCQRGIAAVVQFHRGEESARCNLADAERHARRLGHQIPGSLALARSLAREHAEAPREALDVLMGGLSDSAEELEETADLLADAVRLAVVVGDREAARVVVQRAVALASTSEVPHRQAIAPHCVGLLEHDAAQLLRAADLYATAGRPLPRAQALEAAAVALADSSDITGARTRFTEAYALYAKLGAEWDLARIQARFRAYGIRRGPRAPHRREQQGWTSLTPTELKVVALVAEGRSNPQIASRLFLSRRTVQTHVSHVLAKLSLHSRTDIAREASRRELMPQTDTDAA